MGEKQIITKENNKIIVTRDIEIPLIPGEYSNENLVKEIEIQCRKQYPKAVAFMQADGLIFIDLTGDWHG